MIQYINTRIQYDIIYMVQYNMVRYNVTFYDTTRYNTIHVTIQYDTIRYDTIQIIKHSVIIIDCVAHLCASEGRYNETKLPTHNLHPRNNSLVSCCLQKNNIKVERCVCCMLLFMWVVSVAWLHVFRVYARACGCTREWARDYAGKGRGGGETDFVTKKIW